MQRILIIEDDPAIQKIYQTKLTAEGYEVVIAATGQEGLSQVIKDNFSLIILDIILPGGLNGFDVLERLRQNPHTKDIPVLILTNLETEAQVALQLGVKDYIVKTDMSLDEVVAKIKGYLTK